MRLAAHQGKSLGEMRATNTSEEITLWRAYELVEGFPLSRVEIAVALAGSAICQTWGGKVKATDLLVRFEDDTAHQQQQLAGISAFRQWAEAHNKLQASATT